MVYNRQLQNIAIEDLQFTISNQFFLDVLLMEIRSETIAYTSKKKKENTEKEQRLEKEIQNLENKTSLSEEETRLLQEKKKDSFVELRKKLFWSNTFKIKGKMGQGKAKK